MKDTLMNKYFQGTQGKARLLLVGIIILVLVCGLIDGGKYYNRGTNWLSVKTGGSINLPKMWDVPFHLGLDLSGGTQLTYQTDMSNIAQSNQAVAAEGARDVIERRVNVFGVSEPIVQTSYSGNSYKIIVELAGVKDVNQAIKMIGETPLLEFKEKSDTVASLSTDEQSKISSYNQDAGKRAEDILGKLLSGGNFDALAKQYTEEEGMKDKSGNLGWITETDNQDAYSVIQNFKPGDYTKDLVKTDNSLDLYKLNGKRQKTNPFNSKETEKEVKASHILICYKGATSCTGNLSKDEALAKIQALRNQATPFNFAQLAKDNSTEPAAKQSSGDLGWFDPSSMVKQFASEVTQQKVGTISQPVETEYGYHIIFKQDERPITEYNVSRIVVKKMTAADINSADKGWKDTELTGKNLKQASVEFNSNDNYPEVSLVFDDQGAKMFEDITSRNVGKPVAIFLDGYPISTPTVNEKITGGKAVISGNFNVEDAKLLAQRLNAGALPVPIQLIDQTTVGASLGSSSLDASLIAGLYGFLLVALFMILYYRFPGLLSVVALSIYGVLVLAIFKIFSITITLAGLAGFILSIGIAVDANVLIFARLREELHKDKPLPAAINDSFNRAWPSIRDGNISTLITCIILMWFTTSIVKGFAVTLFFGVITSIFTAIVVTKTLLQLFSGPWLEKRMWLIGGYKKKA